MKIHLSPKPIFKYYLDVFTTPELFREHYNTTPYHKTALAIIILFLLQIIFKIFTNLAFSDEKLDWSLLGDIVLDTLLFIATFVLVIILIASIFFVIERMRRNKLSFFSFASYTLLVSTYSSIFTYSLTFLLNFLFFTSIDAQFISALITLISIGSLMWAGHMFAAFYLENDSIGSRHFIMSQMAFTSINILIFIALA